MTVEAGKKGRFRSKGASILEGQGSVPMTMEEFLDGAAEKGDSDGVSRQGGRQPEKTGFAQNHKPPNAQEHILTKAQNPLNANLQTGSNSEAVDSSRSNLERVERLHVQIRKDLADKLLEIAFYIHSSGMKRREATQRAIIEAALEDYFQKHDKASPPRNQ